MGEKLPAIPGRRGRDRWEGVGKSRGNHSEKKRRPKVTLRSEETNTGWGEGVAGGGVSKITLLSIHLCWRLRSPPAPHTPDRRLRQRSSPNQSPKDGTLENSDPTSGQFHLLISQVEVWPPSLRSWKPTLSFKPKKKSYVM